LKKRVYTIHVNKSERGNENDGTENSKAILVIVITVGSLLACFATMRGISTAKNTSTVPKESMKQKHTQLLKQTIHLAQQGMVKSSEFGLYSTRKEIEAKWGKADRDSQFGELKYTKRHMIFNFSTDKHESIWFLSTTDKNYFSVTYVDLKKTLGKPYAEYTDDSDPSYYSVLYKAGENTVSFIFHRDKQGKLNTIQEVQCR
jgi:hypothetical protein